MTDTFQFIIQLQELIFHRIHPPRKARASEEDSRESLTSQSLILEPDPSIVWHRSSRHRLMVYTDPDDFGWIHHLPDAEIIDILRESNREITVRLDVW